MPPAAFASVRDVTHDATCSVWLFSGSENASAPPQQVTIRCGGLLLFPQLAPLASGRDAMRRALLSRGQLPVDAPVLVKNPADWVIATAIICFTICVIAVMAPRAGKTTALTAPGILDAPGAVLATSTIASAASSTPMFRGSATVPTAFLAASSSSSTRSFLALRRMISRSSSCE